MELAPTIVLTVGLVLVSALGVHAYRYWAGTNASSIRLELERQHVRDLQLKDQEIETAVNAARALRWRNQQLKKGIVFTPDDDDYLEEEIDAGDEEKLSDFAKLLYPKLPKAIGQIIDDESFQGAIVNTAKKNSSGIAKLIERFVKPEEDQGSSTNTTPKLKETYV